MSRIKIEEPYSKCVIIIWEGERHNTTYRQYLEEISPYDMYASTKKEVALRVQPIMLKLHTKFQIISMDGSQVLVNENLCVHNTKIQSQKSGQQEVDV